MPATIDEFIRSPAADYAQADSTVDKTYKILGTEDEDEAMTLLVTTAPGNQALGGYLLSKVAYSVDHTDYGVWTGTARYSKRSKQKPELQLSQSSYQFETGGGNIHITHSQQTIQKVVDGGGTPPEFYNAIGVNGDQIAGCDIISPVYNFSESHVLPASAVSGAYKLALFRATGKVNDATFKGLDAGEVLFLGASGSSRGDDEWEINYRFAASENVTGLTVGGLSGINKKGWEYLWLYFVDDVSETTLVKKPFCAIVDQVYRTHSFANIGIGT